MFVCLKLLKLGVEIDTERAREREREREANSNHVMELAIRNFGELSEFQGGFRLNLFSS